jgi:hypothetical protein
MTADIDHLSLSIESLSARSGLKRSFLYQEIKLGRLPARKAGKRLVILADDARRYLETLPQAAA